jgi:ATP-dependent DNA helicase RecQ
VTTEREQWRSVFRQLVALGLLIVDIEGHGGLRLGPDCRAVLRGERRIELRHDAIRPASRAPRPRPRGARPPAAKLERYGDTFLAVIGAAGS